MNARRQAQRPNPAKETGVRGRPIQSMQSEALSPSGGMWPPRILIAD